MKPFGIRDLIDSETQTELATRAAVREIPALIHDACDSILNILHFVGDLPNPDSDDGLFRFLAHSHYLQAPHTTRTILLSIYRGYYFESVILLRGMVEFFAQLRYFEGHQSELHDHLHPDKRGPTFKVIFEAISPGYYDKYYGRFLSVLAHGKGAGSAFFRYDRSDPSSPRIKHGCEFDKDQMSLVVNQLMALLYGFLAYFPQFFPANTLAEHEKFAGARQETLQRLDEAMISHKKEFPDSAPWHATIDKLVRP